MPTNMLRVIYSLIDVPGSALTVGIPLMRPASDRGAFSVFHPRCHDRLGDFTVEALSMASVGNINQNLDGHIVLDLECLDRIYLNAYVPNVQVAGQATAKGLVSPASSAAHELGDQVIPRIAAATRNGRLR